MEIECPCGETLRVGYYNEPGSGFLLSEKEYHALFSAVRAGFREFFTAVKDNQRDDWLRRQFGSQCEVDPPDAEQLDEFVQLQFARATRWVSECPKCGRLLVDRKLNDALNPIAYSPDDEGFHELLGPPDSPATN